MTYLQRISAESVASGTLFDFTEKYLLIIPVFRMESAQMKYLKSEYSTNLTNNMRTVNIAVLAGALSMVLMGCPYESKLPLDTADKSKPDKSLCKEWDEKDNDDDIWKCELDGNQYKITKKSLESPEEDPTVYFGWLTQVGEAQFLNVYEQSYEDKSYMLWKMVKKGEGDRIKFMAVTDNITEEFTTSEDLKAFVKKNMELSFFYNKDDEKTFYSHDD